MSIRERKKEKEKISLETDLVAVVLACGTYMMCARVQWVISYLTTGW